MSEFAVSSAKIVASEEAVLVPPTEPLVTAPEAVAATTPTEVPAPPKAAAKADGGPRKRVRQPEEETQDDATPDPAAQAQEAPPQDAETPEEPVQTPEGAAVPVEGAGSGLAEVEISPWLIFGGAAGAVAIGGLALSGGSSRSAATPPPPPVTPVNVAPVAVADAGSATEGGGSVTGSVAANDSDANADTLTYALNAPVAGLTLAANGSYSFDPSNAAYQDLAAGATRTVTATYTVSDGKGGTASSTLTITVTGTNDAPVAVADTASATEDAAAVTGSVATNDSDADGDALTYALNAPVAGLTLAANGGYSFDPSNAAYQDLAAGATRTVTAAYTVSDGQGGTASANLTLTVTGVNDAPVAVADAYAVDEDGTLTVLAADGVLANDTDAEGDALTATLVDDVSNGVLAFNPDGGFTYTPDADFTGADSFTYVVDDGTEDGATVTVALTVDAVNDAPTVAFTAGASTFTPRGGEILVNTAVAGAQTAQQITTLSNGGFVITWQDPSAGVGGASGDASGFAIKAQVFAPGGAPVGAEILVNTAVAGNQGLPQITTLSNGGFVITWQDPSTGVDGAQGDTSGFAVKAQVFAAGGAPVAGEILVNTAVFSDQFAPQITALSDGGFVVTWQDLSQGAGGAGGDGSFYAVKAQVFAAGGTPVGGEIRVNTAVLDYQGIPQITGLSDGGFVVTWQDNSLGAGGAVGDANGTAIKAQVFAAGGAAVGDEILVNTAVAGDQYGQQITALADGGFVVTWTDLSAGVGGADGDNSSYAVKAQVFATGGTPVGGEILVNTAVADYQHVPQITALSNGGFVVTWEDFSRGAGGAGGDASSLAVKAQVFAGSGAPVGGEILVNTAVASVQSGPQITALADGGFVVTWQDYSAGGGASGDASSIAVKAQVFAASGTLMGGEILVNTAVAGSQDTPQITALPDGGFVVTWKDSSLGVGGAGGDASGTAIKAQVFAVQPFAATEQVALDLKGKIAVADIDAGGSALTVTLAVDYGLLSVAAGTSGATVTNSGTRSVTVTGTLAQIQALLDTDATSAVTYSADTDAPPASAQLSVTLNDGGATGSGGALSVTVPQTITITGVNDAPTAVGDSHAVAEDGVLTVVAADGVLDNDSDPEGSALTATLVSNVSNGVLALSSDGGFTYTPNADFTGSDSFTYRANDGTADGAAVTVTLNVTAVNDAPTVAFAADETAFTPLGGEILVNTAVTGSQNDAQITALSGGGFVVTWTDVSLGNGGATGDASSNAIKAQVFAAGGAPVGGEIRVNTAVTNNQFNPQITALSDGGFVVTWSDLSQGDGGATGDASSNAVKAQVFAAGGATVGGEIRVNTAVSGNQITPQITALSNGGFVVTWSDFSVGNGGATGDPSGAAVKAQVFAAGGAPVGDEIRVNTAVSSTQDTQQITALSNGGFVVTWRDLSQGVGGATGDTSSAAVKAQVFAAGGAAVGGEIRVNTAVASIQDGAQITALSNGGFVVTWQDSSNGFGGAGGDASSLAVKAQVFAAGGAPVGGEIRVNTAVANTQNLPQITALSNGGFVVTWTDSSFGVGGAGGDASSLAVKAQVFAAGGATVGGEIRVNTAVAGSQANSQITALSDGGFVVTWQDGSLGAGGATGDASSNAIKAQAFTAGGAAVGGEIRVNTAVSGNQTFPQITALSDGGFVVTWQDDSRGAGGATGDASSFAVKAQVFAAPLQPFAATEQVALDLKGVIAVADIDAGASAITVILAVDYGVLDVTAGTSGAIVAGSGTSSVTLTGTLAQIQALLDTDATSAVTYTADTDTPPALAELSVTVNDGGATGSGGALSVAVTQEITIAAVNDVPVAVADAYAVDEDGTLTVLATDGVLANDTDAESEALTATLVDDVSNGVLAFNANGGFTYTPDAEFSGSDSFTYVVDDGTDDGNTVTVALTVDAVNDAPMVAFAAFENAFTPLGDEIRVNTAVVSAQYAPQITALPDGGFVVTWTDLSSGAGGATGDASGTAVKAQVFAAGGAAVGGEIRVNTAVSGDQEGAQTTVLSNGGFVVTWHDYSAGDGGAGGDASSAAVKAQMFTAGGAPFGAEFLVNTAVTSLQAAPQITALSDGGFVVTWNDFSAGDGGASGDAAVGAIKAQMFAAGGAPVGGEILVNTAVANNQTGQQITALSDGGFVVTWNDFSAGDGGASGDAAGGAIKAQVFAAGGAPVGGEIRVNTAVANDQTGQQITALSDGGFVVTWNDNSFGAGGAGGDASSTAIKAQVFAAGGAAVGGEILVNTAVANAQASPQITALSDGGFVVTWTDQSAGVGGATGDPTSNAVKAQVFAAGGAPVGGEILVNTAVANNQLSPQITALSDGGFVVTWADGSLGAGGATGDASNTAVKAQAFTAGGVPVGGEILVNTAVASIQNAPQITALSDGGFAVTWQDYSGGVGGATGDASSIAVKAQVFAAPSEPFAATEQVALDLKGKVAVADVDAGASAITVTLAVDYGVLDVTAGTSGAIVVGSGTDAVTLTGTLAQIQALLDTDATSAVTYTADTDTPPASAELSITVDDGDQDITGTQTIAITATAEAPIPPAPPPVPEDGGMEIGDFGGYYLASDLMDDPAFDTLDFSSLETSSEVSEITGGGASVTGWIEAVVLENGADELRDLLDPTTQPEPFAAPAPGESGFAVGDSGFSTDLLNQMIGQAHQHTFG